MIRKILVSITSIALSAGLVYWGWSTYDRMMSEGKGPPHKGRRPGGFPVEVLEVRPRTIQEVLLGYGTARAFREADIASQVEGKVIEIPEGLRVGSAIKKSGLLAQVDSTDYRQEIQRLEGLLAQATADLSRTKIERENIQARIKVARSELEVAGEDYHRTERLVQRGIAPETDLTQPKLRQQGYEQALLEFERRLALTAPEELAAGALVKTRQAELEKARSELARTRITAPFSGFIARKEIEQGELVRPNQVLFRLVDLSRLEIPMELPASKIESIRKGSPARLFLEKSVQAVAEARVDRISPQVDLQNRTFRAFLVVKVARPGETALRPGLFLKAEIDGRTFSRALAVPRSVFVGNSLFLARDAKAHEIRPRMKTILGDDYLVGDVLKPGDKVITSNLEIMFDGRQIKLKGPRPETASRGPEL